MRTLLRCSAVMMILAVTMLAQTPLQIVGAYWGYGNNFADVTTRVSQMVQGNGLNMPVNVGTLGVDPLPGQGKVLRVYYLQNGQFNQGEWRENVNAQIGYGQVSQGGQFGQQGVPGFYNGSRRSRVVPFRIDRATYGAGAQTRDVTALLQSRVANNRLDLPVNNDAMGGDPAYNQVKQLQLTYEWGGQVHEITANENDLLALPDGLTAGGGVPTSRLRIVNAKYGMLQGNRLSDVTTILQRNISGDRLVMQVNNNTMGGDPARGGDKTLYIIYEFNGQRLEKKIDEDNQLTLP